ncbi:tetratricopeptide repeat protein [Hephaestia sp. GCM10023244]|uniref:tetratricopeptide repeat protein n=1 Tax=unclassified Hephaestia TaxID=2631281 RepID=UPI0020770C8C|nr:tetratricopeptide repeat protein [Hephaestia sp. MAHUQ-44]MCM8730156.1 tetratricopeptide repeat protein [Hephaestia sp. MAHUQ-44]
MVKISRAALAAVMMMTAGGLIVASPVAAKKKQEQQAPQLKLSDAVRKAAVAARDAIAAKDIATAQTNVDAAIAAATNDDERYIAQALKLSLTATQGQIEGAADAAANARHDQALIAPLEALISNPSTPATEVGNYSYMRGSIAFNQQKYAEALTFYQKAQAVGFTNQDLPLQMVKAKVESGDVAGGMVQLGQLVEQEKAAGRVVPEAWYRYAIGKLYKTNDSATTLQWVQRWLGAYPTSKNWRDAIIVFGFQGPTAARMGKPERVDLFRLMRASKSLADQSDYLEYAGLTFDLGLPSETKTVLAEGTATGRIASSSADASALARTAQDVISRDESLASLTTKSKARPDGKLAAQTADAYLGGGDYTHAIELYRLALEKGSVDTDAVNTHLGIALALTGDKAGATTAFDAVQAAPRTDIAALWKTWLNVGAQAAPAAAATAAQ